MCCTHRGLHSSSGGLTDAGNVSHKLQLSGSASQFTRPLLLPVDPLAALPKDSLAVRERAPMQFTVQPRERVCRYDPSGRPRAVDALAAAYFFEEPEAADDRTMLEFMRVNRPLWGA